MVRARVLCSLGFLETSNRGRWCEEALLIGATLLGATRHMRLVRAWVRGTQRTFSWSMPDPAPVNLTGSSLLIDTALVPLAPITVIGRPVNSHRIQTPRHITCGRRVECFEMYRPTMMILIMAACALYYAIECLPEPCACPEEQGVGCAVSRTEPIIKIRSPPATAFDHDRVGICSSHPSKCIDQVDFTSLLQLLLSRIHVRRR